MAFVIQQLQKVKRATPSRPCTSPYCQGETFQHWGQGQERVRDPHLRSVTVDRYCCCYCQRTLKHCSEGVGRAARS